MSETMSHIFISYVEEDAAVAWEVARGLEAAGYSAWYYERDGVTPGIRYAGQIVRAIEQSQAFILILSRHSLGSRHIDAEVICAYEHGKPFIPVRAELTHEEIQQLQPGWRMPLRDAVSIAVPEQGVGAILPQIIRGLESLKVGKTADESPTMMLGGEAGKASPLPATAEAGARDIGADAAPPSAPGRAGEKFRDTARIEIPKFTVFWCQWILASFVFAGTEGEERGVLFTLLVPPAVLFASYIAREVSDDLIVGGITGGLIAGILGGFAGYFAAMKDADGTVFGLSFGLINGAYLLGLFQKERRSMGLPRAGIVTLTTLVSLLFHIGVLTHRYGAQIMTTDLGGDLWRGLLGSTMAVMVGFSIHMYLKQRGH